MTEMPIPPQAAGHWFHKVPVLGWIARDIARGDDDTIWYALAIFLTQLVLAYKAWGLVAIAMTALAAVPVVFILLLLITVGR